MQLFSACFIQDFNFKKSDGCSLAGWKQVKTPLEFFALSRQFL